jgi:cytidylate kinase
MNDGDGEQIDLITVSREYGAGGSEFATALGERLGWRVFDRDIIEDVAQRLHLDRGTVEMLDEQAPGLFARVAQMLMVSPSDAPFTIDTSGLLSPDAVAHASQAALREASQSPRVIVVGHAGQAIFGGRPNTLHLRLVAPIEVRVERICRRITCDEATARMTAHRMDQGREAYVRRYHHVEWRDPLLYHLQINTGRVSIPEAVDIVAGMVNQHV